MWVMWINGTLISTVYTHVNNFDISTSFPLIHIFTVPTTTFTIFIYNI